MPTSVRDAFTDAAFALVSPAPLRPRLVNAWAVHLEGLRVDAIPARHRLGFVALREAMHLSPELLTDEEAWTFARWVVSVALALEAARTARQA